MSEAFAAALEEAGGVRAPAAATAHLQRLLAESLAASRAALRTARPGRVDVAFAPGLAVLPVDARFRADPSALGDRAWPLVAAAVGALADAGGAGELAAGGSEQLVLALAGADPELAVVRFDELAGGIDRVRAVAHAVPAALVRAGESRPPAAGHPLAVALRVARAGRDPTDPDAADALEPADAPAPARPHEDPDPAMRIARRILQRLDGMGKWGGFHTEFTHLPRGFAGNDRALASAVGEALLDAGLLAEKPSVGQRHVFLNPRRAGDIRRLIDDGTAPAGLNLPVR